MKLKIAKNSDKVPADTQSSVEKCTSQLHGFCEECPDDGGCSKQRKYSASFYRELENEHISSQGARNLTKLQLGPHYTRQPDDVDDSVFYGLW